MEFKTKELDYKIKNKEKIEINEKLISIKTRLETIVNELEDINLENKLNCGLSNEQKKEMIKELKLITKRIRERKIIIDNCPNCNSHDFRELINFENKAMCTECAITILKTRSKI